MVPRVCPGKQFALRTLYLFVACVSAVFDVEPALDEDGNPKIPEAEFTCDATIRYVFLGTSICTVAMWLTLASGDLNLSNLRPSHDLKVQQSW